MTAPHSAPAGGDEGWTKGPWPWAYTGDGKRIVIGDGLVEGPNGYAVAEVYSDDCPQEVAEASDRLIAADPAGLAVAEQTYLALLSHPFDAWRVRNQAVLSGLLSFIAKATSRDEEAVQNAFEEAALLTATQPGASS